MKGVHWETNELLSEDNMSEKQEILKSGLAGLGLSSARTVSKHRAVLLAEKNARCQRKQ